MTARFLTVGEALTDIVVPAQGPRREHPGGSPLNVAVALGRLGHTSHLLTRIGDDERGHAIAAHLQRSAVELTPGSIDHRPTSTAEATLDASGAATYVFDLDWDPDPAGLPEQVDAVHTSSIAAVLEPGATTVARVLDQYRAVATISYDPNARPSLMGDAAAARARMEQMVERADVVKASDEDVAWFYGTDDLEDVVSSWRQRGPALTVMTRGAGGAVGFVGEHRVEVPGVPVEVADTVGAGDTFSAGILHALETLGLLGAARRDALAALTAADLDQVLTRAAALAAVTVSRPGADPPWASEVD
ncbi:carbohydrate kinase [Brachybacterium sp. EF45031]|uniref:carbohydrate kinase family protein n=1 Tax=Brachybacterium sillae TaxID=2810536 RepID=UPI00217D1D02|nr:carbohydrate kinase [Brachybacterium sillae]MCS6711173.1 carbohydrate kinase [Brachybacterium sillae]